MAHLIRCWCGRQYRCEGQEHDVRPNVISCFDFGDCCDRCPDSVIHSPRFVPGRQTIEFKLISIPVIKEKSE